MKYQILILMLMLFGKCNSQNRDIIEVNIDQYVMQVKVAPNYSINIQQGFDSKIYRAISKSQETVLEIEVGFDTSKLFFSKGEFEGETSNKETLIIQNNNLKVSYLKNENSFRNISGKIFYPTKKGYLNCLNFEVSEKEFQSLITIFHNIKIKKQ